MRGRCEPCITHYKQSLEQQVPCAPRARLPPHCAAGLRAVLQTAARPPHRPCAHSSGDLGFFWVQALGALSWQLDTLRSCTCPHMLFTAQDMRCTHCNIGCATPHPGVHCVTVQWRTALQRGALLAQSACSQATHVQYASPQCGWQQRMEVRTCGRQWRVDRQEHARTPRRWRPGRGAAP